jgi:hypothetical protein
MPKNMIPGDFSPKKRKKNEKKRKKRIKKKTEYHDFMECEDLAERVNFAVCVCP